MEIKEKVEDAVDSFLLFWGFARLIELCQPGGG